MIQLLASLMVVVLSLQGAALARAQEPSESACFDILDFEGKPAGSIVDQVFGPGGAGPIVVRGINPEFESETNAAILFDSSCPGRCSGGDGDLGTPNRDYGGPGRGSGGVIGSPFTNSSPLGNVLIIAENLVDSDGDGLVDDPDDQADRTVTTSLDFSALGTVTLREMTVIDIDPVGDPGRVDLLASGGAILVSFALPKTGDNGVAIVSLGPTAGVERMIVTAHQSAAIDNIVLARSCDDLDACTQDICDVDTCIHEALESCAACTADADCDDADPCTDDRCAVESGTCSHLDNQAPCDDGLYCNGVDVCDAGACAIHEGTPCEQGERCDESVSACVIVQCEPEQVAACDDGNPCTDDSCDAATGACINVANTAACDDGLFCNGADSCSDGSCAAHAGDPCVGGTECADACDEQMDACFVGAESPCADDGNPCTDDVCDGGGTCLHVANLAPCDDGLFCNGADMCERGICSAHTGDPCVGAGQACDEATESCVTLECTTPSDPACDDGNACTDDSCNVADGTCQHASNAAPCDDGNACTTDDTCGAGSCQPGAPRACTDGNACTDDRCEPASGCAFADNAAPCDDGVFCNGADTCAAGSCSAHAGEPCVGTGQACDEAAKSCVTLECTTPSDPACDDGNACTDDSCNMADGTCQHTNNTAPCDDANACTTGDTCGGGSCQTGTAVECVDGNECTDDACDPASGCVFSNNAAPCDDGIFCNGADTCAAGACAAHGGDPCAGGGECADACDEGADVCFAAAATACTDDGNLCTDDVCDGAGACSHPSNAAPCEDGVFCNGTDTCASGACSLHDGDPCAGTGQLCDEVAETCIVPECTSPSDPACDDGNACTDDSCNVVDGTCQHANNTASCDDGVFCNGTDTCASGACSVHGGDPCAGGSECADTCDEAADACFDAGGTACTEDGNPCTDDVCDGAGACGHPSNAAPCDDGIFCNGADTCASGACAAHAGDPCTEAGQLCDETAETCAVPECTSPSDAACDDGNACTDDSCDVAGGTCQHTNNTAACSDGDACTTGDTCGGGSCQGGVPLVCDDDNGCTDDTCDPASGCIFSDNTSPCDDGIFCNGADTCASGACTVHVGDPCVGGPECADQCNEAADGCFAVSGTPCADDGNACTNDTCNGAGVCSHPGNAAPCDDGIFCNGLDTCAAGACSLHAGDPCTGGESCSEEVGACRPPSTCTTAPRLVVADTACPLGSPCQVSVLLDAGGNAVVSLAAKLSSTTGLTCGTECLAGAAAAGNGCFINAALCTFGVADLIPPLTPFGDGEVAVLDVTCAEPGIFEIALDNVSLGGTSGLPVDGACGASGLLVCGSEGRSAACSGSALDECDDGDPCTTDACTAGTCSHDAVVCDDGLFCNGQEFCGTDGCQSAAGPCVGECDEATDACIDPSACVALGLTGPVQCPVGQSCNVSVSIDRGGHPVGSVTAEIDADLAISCETCVSGADAANGQCALNAGLCRLQVTDTSAPFDSFGDGELASVGLQCNAAGSGTVCVTAVDAFAPDGSTEAPTCPSACTSIECVDPTFVCASAGVCSDGTSGPRMVSVDTLCTFDAPCQVPLRAKSGATSLGAIAGRVTIGDGLRLAGVEASTAIGEAYETSSDLVPYFSVTAAPGSSIQDGEALLADVVCDVLGTSSLGIADLSFADTSQPQPLAICGGCTLPAAVVCVEDASAVACGDADLDGDVDPTDALWILRHAVGTGDACPSAICDVDASGSVCASDAMAVLLEAVGARELSCPTAGDASATSTTVP